jgi:hypothetical protein
MSILLADKFYVYEERKYIIIMKAMQSYHSRMTSRMQE